MLDSLLPLTSVLRSLLNGGNPHNATSRYLLPLTSYLTKGEGLLSAENDLDAPVAAREHR